LILSPECAKNPDDRTSKTMKEGLRMNQNKVGAFMKDLRKEKGITQE
jgi:hypothetical protein